jgi:integrative and conjugative element protein (TIGR02256 family)
LPGVQEDLVFRNPLNDGFILIAAAVVQQIRRHRQLTAFSTEAGGILLGLRRGRHLEVTMATTPKRADWRSRLGFHRLSRFHQKHATRAWLRFQRTVDYLGEWHTHPERFPTPSGIDRAEWGKLTRSRTSDLLFVIVGTEGLWVSIGKQGRICPISVSPPNT